MSREPVISIRDLSKAYNIYERPLDVVKEALFGGVRHDTFWALRNLSLDIFDGQRVGIIGPNGAGKSTLLKIISGNLPATSGSLQVNGEVSAMLSLTSFLNPDQTGLENIRFNLVVNGVPRRDIPRLTEEIVDFTELGAFIRAPVRTYSSGMNARLAFAISTARTPDILIVDEVLGAGDAYFAAKATVRMIELCERGRALLFVSHSTAAVQMLCNLAVWMDNGGIREIGPVDEIARRYEADFRRQEDEHLRPGNAERRAVLDSQVRPEEFGRPGVWRLRITGPNHRVVDTHYVRAVTLTVADRTIDVPLTFADIEDEGVEACLDIAASEWGREHDRQGEPSRALAPRSSSLRGGQILLRTTGQEVSGAPVTVTFESTSVGGVEELSVYTADAQSGEWRPLELVERAPLASNWERSTFSGVLSAAEGPASTALRRLVEESRPDVEILDTVFSVDGRETLSVAEEEPFSIAVTIRANRRVDVADVWLKFVRIDGFYTFWQSSGQVGENLHDIEGEKIVTFHFDPNIFGAGDYEVEVDVANGFDVEHNWPHTQVFDRKVGALKFTVTRRWKLLMFGPVNARFPVSVEDVPSSETLPSAASGSGTRPVRN